MKRIRYILAMLCGMIIISLPSVALAVSEPLAPTTPTTTTTPAPAATQKSAAATPKVPAAAAPLDTTSKCGAYNSTAKSQVLEGISQTGTDCTVAEKSISNLIGSIVRTISVVVGIVAVIIILFSGFKYITSAGDASKIASAKTTLIYALVGLLVAALAQFLVSFALNFNSQCQYNNSLSPSDPACVAPTPKAKK